LSSAILYLAIVAIWAVVLVPRWLRPPHAAPQAGLAEEGADAGGRDDPEAAPDGETAAGAATAAARPPAGAPPAPEVSAPAASGPEPPARAPVPAGLTAAERRSRILRARRRTLSTLVLLTTGAVALAMARLAAWWVALPPGIMLAGFLLLLREAARIDAERAVILAAQEADGATPKPARQRSGGRAAGPGQAPAVPAADATGGRAAEPAAHGAPQHGQQPSPAQPSPAQPAAPDADVIDISARIGDQLYDQYDDAEARAIGD